MSQTYFLDHHHLQSQEGDPLLQQIKSIHLAYLQMDHRCIPFRFKTVSWLGSNAQTLSKAEIGDHTPARMKKALAQSLSKSLLIFETCQKSQCSLVTPIDPVWHGMQPLYFVG